MTAKKTERDTKLGRKARDVRYWWWNNLPPDRQGEIIEGAFEAEHPTHHDKQRATEKWERQSQ